MSTNKKSAFTYQNYLHNVWYDKDMADENDIVSFAELIKNTFTINHAAIPMIFIIDYVKSSYLLMSDGIKIVADYDARDFLDNGLQKVMDIYHKDDFKIYNQSIFKKNIELLQITPQEQHKDLVFTYNFRIKSKNKKNLNFLQKGFYITDKTTKMPRYSLGAITDITNVIREENVMTHIVQQTLLKDKKPYIRTLTHDYYFSGEENNILTKREHIILSLIVDGLNTKTIAEKLKISPYTVNNHRQNIMIKTGAKNIAQLIMYAVKNKII